MKSKFSSIWRVAIALVMVLSLGLVVAPAAALTASTVTNAPQTWGAEATYTVAFNTAAGLAKDTGTITITFPDDTAVPDEITPAKVTVNGTACTTVDGVAADRQVIITVPKAIPAGAVTVVISKDAEVKNPTTVGANWKLKVKTSTEPVDVESAVYSTVASVPPTLTADITSPADGASVSVGKTFTVTAVVANSGGSTATAVTAAIAITGSATVADDLKAVDPATLAVGGSGVVTWEVTCTAAGAVTIKVTPAGEYLYVKDTELDIPDANLNFDQIAVTQQLAAKLEVTAVTAPSTVKVGETFTATATVKNTGVAKAKDVELTIAISGNAGLTGADKDKAKKTELDVAGLAEIAGGASVNVPWLLLCTAPGDAIITVTPAGTDANTKEAITTLTPRSTIVVQTAAAVLEVTITVPSDPSSYLVGGTFTVTATVKNTGASTAKDVALTLTILDAKCALKASEVATKPVGYLAPGETSGDVTWELVCTAPGKDKITVSPSGKDVLTGTAIPAGSLISDSVTVLQSVTTHDIILMEGWNLISLPLIPIDPTIGTVLAGVSKGVTVNKVAYYTGGPAGSWLSWFPPPTPIDLYQMKDGNGYWIDVTLNTTLTVTGVELALPGQVPPTYNIVVGWNLIGFTGKDKTAGKYLGPAVKLTVEAMYGYNAEAGLYYPVLWGTNLTPGSGYWLAVNAAGKIYP